MRHRTNCAALATASDWIFNYMIVQITPVAISNIGWKTYMIFFVLNLFFALVVYLFYPGMYTSAPFPSLSFTNIPNLQKQVDVPWKKSICYTLGTTTDCLWWTRGAFCCPVSEQKCIVSMSLRPLTTRLLILRLWRRSWRMGRGIMRRLLCLLDAKVWTGSLWLRHCL